MHATVHMCAAVDTAQQEHSFLKPSYLEGPHQAQGLVNAAANWQVVDSDLAQDTGWADDEQTTAIGEGHENTCINEVVTLCVCS